MDCQLKVTEFPISSLKAFPSNARSHSSKQIGQIARSIAAFGFNVPVLIDPEGEVIAGHGRVAAAQSVGMENIRSSFSPTSVRPKNELSGSRIIRSLKTALGT